MISIQYIFREFELENIRGEKLGLKPWRSGKKEVKSGQIKPTLAQPREPGLGKPESKKA